MSFYFIYCSDYLKFDILPQGFTFTLQVHFMRKSHCECGGARSGAFLYCTTVSLSSSNYTTFHHVVKVWVLLSYVLNDINNCNGPFPICHYPSIQTEAKCLACVRKCVFNHREKNLFLVNGQGRCLAKATPKWPANRDHYVWDQFFSDGISVDFWDQGSKLSEILGSWITKMGENRDHHIIHIPRYDPDH